MFVCYICCKAEPSIPKFRAHLQRHHVVGELQYPILCHDCKSSFATIYNLVRHVTCFHGTGSVESSSDVPVDLGISAGACNDAGCASDSDDTDGLLVTDSDVTELYNDVCTEGISLVAGLRANSSMPFSVVPGIVQSFNDMSSSLVSLISTG